MGTGKAREKRSIVLLAAMLMLAAAFVLAAGGAPYFTPTPPSSMTCYQNSTCFYDFNATDDEGDPFNFSIDTPPFSENIDPNTGILNFTPTNEQVEVYPFAWAIVKETDTGNGSVAIITWTIININDPPNITSWHPQNLTNVTEKEGGWVMFNVTATDPDLMHNDTLNFTWLLDGAINTTLLNYTGDTANYTPDYLSAGMHYITINVTDNQSAWDSITWTVNITNENRAPVNNATIPNITMTEDTGNYSVINLSDYFYDNDTDDYPLHYNFTFIAGNNITIIINETEPNNVSFIPHPNFNGTNTIKFSCFDGYNTTFSNNIVINVTGVSDPPIVQQVQNQTAYADTLFQLQIQASDPDFDALTYYDNTTLFDINPTTGFISKTFNTSQIGSYSILINVSDGVFNTSMAFNLSIINNTAPVLGGKPLPNVTTTEGNLTTMLFNATDIDTTDLLNFSASCIPASAKICNITTTNESAENGRGQIVFMPDQSDIDAGPTYKVTITVNDSKGATDSSEFNITVLNTEHYPQLSPYPIPNQRMKVNRTFMMNLSATDEDGNLDVFGDNTSLFNITTYGASGYGKTGAINFTPNDSDVGEHWVNITVNDTTAGGSLYNWSLALFNVTLNTPPTIQPIADQNATEDHEFNYTLNTSDPDPQDTLLYYDNTTLFNISGTGLISFTPNASQVGEFIINITVSDGEANTSTLMNLTIGRYNDYPYWIPPLDEYYVNETTYLNTSVWNSSVLLNYSTNMTVWNSSIYEKNYTQIYMDAYDEENPTLTFSRAFLNFTNASNDTVTSGIELFSITSAAGHRAYVNFTPNNSQVGAYYVNFTITDFKADETPTTRTNTTTIRLEVFNVNDAPTITNHSPDVTYYQNMSENSSMMFNVTAIDVDYGDSLRYQWALNGSNISGANLSYYNYTTGFYSAGWRNMTVLVLDRSNASAMLNWTINVSNVNRIGWFGQIRQYNYTHFDAGVTKTNVTILPDEQGVILYDTGFGYRPSGLFESSVLDARETNRRHLFSKINWTGNTTMPNASFDIYFQTRTADQPSPLLPCNSTISTPYNSSITYNASNSAIIADNDRCIQYRFIMATNNTTYTPSINSVTIGYLIANRSQEQNSNQTWIDLDSYFFEPDSDDNVTFNATTTNGTAVTDLSIAITPSAPHRAYVATNSVFVGSTEVVLHMSDGYNTTDSNAITINVTEAQAIPQVIIVPVGGGGAVSRPVPYEVPTYVTSPVSFRLIAPQIVTTYANDTMEVPINLFNDGNFTLKNIKLNATTANKDVAISLSREDIDLLKPYQKEFLTLTVESYKTYGTYEVLIEATAEATSVAEDGTEKTSTYTEKTKVFVNSLLKAAGNESQVNTKLAFAEDLLSNNPECLELNEFLKKVKKEIAEKNNEKADKMLDQVMESCKYLIAPKKEKAPEIEKPSKVYGLPTESLFVLGTVSLVTLAVAIALVIGWAHIRSKKPERLKKI